MSSNTGYIMTLANTIIGVGILAMPYCFNKCGILLSILLLVLSNLITRFACYYLLKSSIKARRKNFEFLASYIFGSSGKLMVELCLIGYLMGSCITYFVVVGDLGPQIIAKLFNINHSDSLRTFIMVIVTIFCIIPLCLLRNIESLSLICISSIIFYFCLVLKIFFESESKMLSTYWYENVHWWRPSGITQCLPIFSMALSCQPQIFDIYESLPNQTIDRMSYIIKHGINICSVVYISVGFFGYVAFYDQPFSGNILLNLSSSYMSDIIQMGFVISVAVSFPLVIFPCRASLYSLLYHRSHSETSHYIPEHRFKYITISMVLVALIIGILIPSIELIIGLVGSTIGVAICIMFPASCFIKINKKNSTEKLAAQFLLVFGFTIMILGTYANLGAIDEQQSGADVPVDHLPIDRLPIDRLSDIHVDEPADENTFMTPAKFEDNVRVEIGPKKPFDTIYDVPVKSKGLKRKILKPSLILPKQSESFQDDIREINLNEKRKNEMSGPKLDNFKPIVQKMVEKMHLDANTYVKTDEKLQDPKVMPNQLIEPTAPKKGLESAINNEAIKKEDQEIEIEKNENQQKDDERTKEILAQVQSALDKQNEKNQKLVLDKINEISEKVNHLEMKNNDQQKIQQENNLNGKIVSNTNTQPQEETVEKTVEMTNTKPTSYSNDPLRKIVLPPNPVVKLLGERISSSAPIQTNLSESNPNGADSREEITNGADLKREKPNEPTIDTIKSQQKVNENIVGRDLLSNSDDFQTVKSSSDRTET